MPKNQSCLIWKPWIIRLSVRTHSIWCGACSIVCRIPGRAQCSQHFTIIPHIYKVLFLHELSFQRRPWVEWLAERDDGMLQSLDLHDSRSAMITFLGRSKRDGSRAQPMMPHCPWRDQKMCKYLQSLRVSQLCPSLVALTRFLLGKGWPRTSKSELMGSCWFTVKILLSLIHDISDNRGYHSGIFAILSIFPLLAGDQREKICMCNNFTLQYEYFTSNIRFDRGWVWCW